MKLESEGIRCFVAGQMLSGTHPLVFSDVQFVQVAEGDSRLAEEILNRPVEQTEDGEYIDEDGTAQKCHRRKVDLVPLTRTNVGCILPACVGSDLADPGGVVRSDVFRCPNEATRPPARRKSCCFSGSSSLRH